MNIPFSLSPALASALLTGALVALTTGCPSPNPDGGVTPDGGVVAPDGGAVDGGDDDGGSAPDDGGAQDGGAFDAGPPPVLDAGPDDSLDDTPFADIALRWERDLELCNAWAEGGALASERERKVRIRLPRQPRASLGEDHLGQSGLDAVTIERGVNAEQRRAGIAPTSSTLTEWSVTPPSGNISWWSLDAVVTHTLPDAMGTIFEQYSLQRSESDPSSDITIGGANSYAYNFYYVPPEGTDADSVFLTECGPSQDTHLVIEALVGAITEGPHAGRHVQVTRYVRTFDVFAGSYPVYWDASQVFFTDSPYSGLTLFGFWPQTYSAAHHNWEEASVLEPRLDVGAYHTLFSQLDNGDGLNIEAISKVEWRNVTNFAQPGSMDVTLQDLTTGVETVHAVELLSAFRPMSARVLARGAQGEGCPIVDVKVMGNNAYSGVAGDAFQVVHCPNDSALGFEVLGVMPIASTVDATTVGVLFETSAITTEGDGFRIQLGTGALSIYPLENAGSFAFDVIDAEGETIISSLGDFSDLQTPQPQDVVTNASGDGVTMTLVRRNAAPGVGESVLYAPVSFSIAFDDEVLSVSAFDKFEYTNSHHNWADRLVVTEGDLVVTWWVTFSEGVLEHHVSATRGSVEVLPDTVVTAAD